MSAGDMSSTCAAAAVAADGISTASGSSASSPSAPSTPDVVAGGPAGRRARGPKKPKIDIDREIQEANRLAELFKKMQTASKVASRNASRSKQRLIRKANKLSEQDLMRLAVLKRCGMFVPETSAEPMSPSAAAVMPSPTKKTKTQEHISSRFKSLVTSVPGAAEVLEALDRPQLTTALSCSLPGGSLAAAPVPVSLQLLPGLHRLPSRPRTTPVVPMPVDDAADGGDAVDAGAVESTAGEMSD